LRETTQDLRLTTALTHGVGGVACAQGSSQPPSGAAQHPPMPVHRTSDNRNRSAPTKNATGELPLNATRSISCVRRRRSMASVVISCLAEPHFKSVIGPIAERASGSLWKMGVGILIEGGDPLKGVQRGSRRARASW